MWDNGWCVQRRTRRQHVYAKGKCDIDSENNSEKGRRFERDTKITAISRRRETTGIISEEEINGIEVYLISAY